MKTAIKAPATIDKRIDPRQPLRLVLVYQAGIANVFRVTSDNYLSRDGRAVVRIYQGDFRTAEHMCYGAALAGSIVRTAGCNMAGDVALQDWTGDLDSLPFSEQFHAQSWN